MTGIEETREEIREGTEGQPMEKKNTKSKKKYLVATLAVCLLLLAAGFLYPFIAPMHMYSLLTGFTYTVYSDHVELDRYYWDLETVWIPDYMWSRPVTVIGENCFSGKYNMEKVILSRHLQVIGTGAFDQCVNLEEVSGGEEVRIIGEDAFAWCQRLQRLAPGKNVEEIGISAFSMCLSLTSFPFGERLDCIELNAFSATGLQELPADLQVSYVGRWAFSGTPWMEKQEEEFVIWSGILMDYNGEDEVVRVPEGVRGVTGFGTGGTEEEKEGGCIVREVYLPDTVEYITGKAFGYRKNLRVYIPASVKELGIRSRDRERELIGDESMTIITTAGSAAEAYAKEMGLACEIVEGW